MARLLVSDSGSPGRILFVSSNETNWGGSEELWAQTAMVLARRGHRVTAAKPNLRVAHPRLAELRSLGCRMVDLAKVPVVPMRLCKLVLRFTRNASLVVQLSRLWVAVRMAKPDLVVLSQGGNWDGFLYGDILHRLGVPYVVIVQKASELYWPPDWARARCKALYGRSRRAFFVSRHNHRLTEEQIGQRVDQGMVVRNPFLHDWNTVLPWPKDQETLRLACVGRLYPMEKGQDVLLRVLARPKWRERAIEVSFYGAGEREEGLRELAAYLGVSGAKFRGFVDDVTGIWEEHHALILPTRAEGLPLVVVETMLAGRVVITTDIAGSSEVCEDGRTGFIAPACNEDDIDAALERAWQRREEWPAIAAAAAREIRQLVPSDPPAELARLLLEVIDSPEMVPEADVPCSKPHAEAFAPVGHDEPEAVVRRAAGG